MRKTLFMAAGADAGSVGRYPAEHQNTARDDASAAVIAPAHLKQQGRVIDPSHGRLNLTQKNHTPVPGV
jgi:hypothetical protein